MPESKINKKTINLRLTYVEPKSILQGGDEYYTYFWEDAEVACCEDCPADDSYWCDPCVFMEE